MATLFDVTSEYELIALNRALLEAKFSGNAYDQEVPVSNSIAEIATRVASQLTSTRPEWKDWLEIDRNRREWSASLVYAISRRSWWCNATLKERSEFVQTLLAPFHFDQNAISSFIDDVDDVLKSGRWYSVWRTIDGSTIRLATKKPDSVRPEEIVVVAPDGESILYRDLDESAVTDWLLQNGFDFVVDGVLPTPSLNAQATQDQ